MLLSLRKSVAEKTSVFKKPTFHTFYGLKEALRSPCKFITKCLIIFAIGYLCVRLISIIDQKMAMRSVKLKDIMNLEGYPFQLSRPHSNSKISDPELEDEQRDEIELEEEKEQEQRSPSNQTVDKEAEIEKLKLPPKLILPVYANEGDTQTIHEEHMYEEDLNVQITPSAKNVTPPNTRLLIYNRVPKCGSTTMYKLIRGVMQENKFHHLHSKIHYKPRIDEEERKILTKDLLQKSKKKYLAFDRHIYYYNTTRLGFPKIAWINQVREPVARFISHFYAQRRRIRWKRDKKLKNRKPQPPNWRFDMKLDDCIEAKSPECFRHPGQSTGLQLSFFCGHHPECRKVGSQWALQRAKRHVENYYSVVGTLEELPLSLSVLEAYLPRYFKTAKSIYLSSGEAKMNVGDIDKRNSVSNSTKEVIRGFLKEDIDFYHFVQQRLHLQAKKMKTLGLLS